MGKVERFDGYRCHRFYVPLVARLNQSQLRLNSRMVTLEVLRWLTEIANARV